MRKGNIFMLKPIPYYYVSAVPPMSPEDWVVRLSMSSRLAGKIPGIFKVV